MRHLNAVFGILSNKRRHRLHTADVNLSWMTGNEQTCVPNVCQLRKSRRSSTAFNHCKNVGNLLIQRMVDKRKASQRTSAKKQETGFVISRSPVRSRRVAPSIWSGIKQLLTICKIDTTGELPGVGTQVAHKNFGGAGDSDAKFA